MRLIFYAACLNSAPARFLIQSYAIEVQVSTHVLAHVRVPEFDGSKLHKGFAGTVPGFVTSRHKTVTSGASHHLRTKLTGLPRGSGASLTEN